MNKHLRTLNDEPPRGAKSVSSTLCDTSSELCPICGADSRAANLEPNAPAGPCEACEAKALALRLKRQAEQAAEETAALFGVENVLILQEAHPGQFVLIPFRIGDDLTPKPVV
jgi:hypothetical protein